jgi:hypothetical protein
LLTSMTENAIISIPPMNLRRGLMAASLLITQYRPARWPGYAVALRA